MMIPNVYCVTSIPCDEALCEAEGLDVVERMMPRVTKSTDAYETKIDYQAVEYYLDSTYNLWKSIFLPSEQSAQEH